VKDVAEKYLVLQQQAIVIDLPAEQQITAASR
jgi:hypothetical protein